MDFARKQLEKYGWSDGKGLGKNENGISQALKPKLKRSVTGIGHDAAADFTEHWWSQLYDKAAKNVEVEDKNGKTKKIKTKDTNEFEITNSMWKIKQKHQKINTGEQLYSDYFIKKAVLDNGGVKMENVSDTESEDEDSVKKDVLKMTDEELFAACEGRTAHKGARHGLKATGKLARIAQQEQMLLNQPQYKGYSHFKNSSKHDNVSVNDLQVVEDMSLNSDGDNIVSKKYKKKKRNRCDIQSDGINDSDLAESVAPLPNNIKNEVLVSNVASDNSDEDCSRKSNKNQHNFKNEIDNGDANVSAKKNRKRKTEKECINIFKDTTEVKIEDTPTTDKKRKKKKKVT